MMKPAFVFDGRQLLDHDALAAIGFKVEAIGKKIMHSSSLTELSFLSMNT